MTTNRSVNFSRKRGALVWAGHDLGSDVGVLQPGASEYEFWRTVAAKDIPALVAALGAKPGSDPVRLVRARFRSDVELDEFATAHGITTKFESWISTNWDD